MTEDGTVVEDFITGTDGSMKRMKHDSMTKFSAGAKADGAVSGYAINKIEDAFGIGVAEDATIGLGAVGAGMAIEGASQKMFGRGPFGKAGEKLSSLSLFGKKAGKEKSSNGSKYGEGYKPDGKSSHGYSPVLNNYEDFHGMSSNGTHSIMDNKEVVKGAEKVAGSVAISKSYIKKTNI